MHCHLRQAFKKAWVCDPELAAVRTRESLLSNKAALYACHSSTHFSEASNLWQGSSRGYWDAAEDYQEIERSFWDCRQNGSKTAHWALEVLPLTIWKSVNGRLEEWRGENNLQGCPKKRWRGNSKNPHERLKHLFSRFGKPQGSRGAEALKSEQLHNPNFIRTLCIQRRHLVKPGWEGTEHYWEGNPPEQQQFSPVQ